jgi:hypothetical protein
MRCRPFAKSYSGRSENPTVWMASAGNPAPANAASTDVIATAPRRRASGPRVSRVSTETVTHAWSGAVLIVLSPVVTTTGDVKF